MSRGVPFRWVRFPGEGWAEKMSYYQDDLTGDLQSFSAEFVPLAFTTRTGESLEFAATRKAENLDEPFEILEDVEIPAGEYWSTRWLLDVSSFSVRTLSGGAELEWGEFYSGENLSISASGRWRVNKHLTLVGDYEHNRVSFEEDSFRVDEGGCRADFAFTPTLFGAVSGQWNTEDEDVILNFRPNWIPRPGSDLFLVINQQAETWDSRWNPTQMAVLTKLVWRMAF